MSSVSSVLAAALLLVATCASTPGPPVLKVGADPNNLPFSNRAGQGFENELARIVARDLGRPLAFVWWPERRGFIRHTLKEGGCDLVLGVPAGFALAQPTDPYYRSTYVFVTRHDRQLGLRSLDDPRLRTLRIGIHVIGDDYASLPPVQALGRRGIVKNIVGYSIYGDIDQPDPPAALIGAVALGDVDVALAWGPLAGYFATRQSVALDVTPIAPGSAADDPPFAFDVAMAVRRGDATLRAQVDAILARRSGEIHDLLVRYGVPLLDRAGAAR